jgi:hypothetical protein
MEPGTAAEWFSGAASAAAVFVALGGYGFLEWQRARDRRDAERTAGRQIGIKLARVMNGTDDIRRHLFAPYNGPPLGGVGATEKWRTIQPLVGLEREPGLMLNAAENDLLVKINATDFLMELMLATGRYQSIISSMNEYRVRYDATYQMLPPPTVMEGLVGQHHLTQEEYLRIRPHSIVLESIIDAMRSMTTENMEKCSKLAEQFNPLMKGYFKEKFLSLSKVGQAE